MSEFAARQKREPKREPPPARTAESATRSVPPTASNLTLQALYAAGAVRAKLVVGTPSDPAEAEANRMAAAAMNGGRMCACAPRGPPCAACRQGASVRRKAKDRSASSPHIGNLGLGGGRRLGDAERGFFEERMHADLSAVRVHDDERAAQASDQLNARAFTLGGDIAFGRGEYQPGTRSGRELIAHELAHTLQADSGPIRRQATCSISGAPQASADADSVVQAVRDGKLDVVVASLRATGIPGRCALRSSVLSGTGEKLERWLMGRRNRPETVASITRTVNIGIAVLVPVVGATGLAVNALLPGPKSHPETASAEEGLRLLLPALPLLDRLELYDEGIREIEQAQFDVIRNASAFERESARGETARLEAIYGDMGVKEEYDARLLIAPDQRYVAAERLLARAPGAISDDEDLVFDAIWSLSPTERLRFWRDKTLPLYSLLSAERYALLGTLARGNEAQALIARLRLATEGRIDDKDAVRAVVDRAIALLNEQKQLRATMAVATLPPDARATAQARLNELGELESLVSFGSGALDPASFLGRIAEAADSPDAFGATAKKLGATISDPEEQRKFALRTAKQRILLAASVTGADEDSIRNAILELRAPPVAVDAALPPAERERKQNEANNALRKDLWDDGEVQNVIKRLTGSQRMRVETFLTADAFDDKMADLTLAFNAARWGEFFQIVLQIAQKDDWRTRFKASSTSAWNTYARVRGEERRIMEAILESGKIPVDQILAYTGDVETLRTVLANLDEERRGQLRTGYLLARSGRAPAGKNELDALAAYREFEGKVRQSQTTLGVVDTAGIEGVLDAALGSEPTAKELETGAGRYSAAALLYERQQARLALGRGASAGFTETDETMLAAAREFGAQWLQLRDRTPHELTTLEFAALSALHDRFTTRSEEFIEASNTAGEIAGMVAATVAGIIIVVGTGGVTAPAVIAAAAAGAGARVVTREMFGGDYYNPAGGEGARDAVLGAIDGALAVVGASIGARGAELIGLSGQALLKTAARIGGEVAEQASGRLAHRVAAGAVQAAIDGAISGFVAEAANALTDSRTWRRGVWQGLVRVGQAALIGGLVGLGAGAVLGAAIPVVGAGLRSAADRVLGASVERTLAKAGATETLEAARKAVRNGNMDEARRLFTELEPHLSAEEANVLWRDLAHIAEQAERLADTVKLAGELHTVRVIQTEQGAFFQICSWCTKVRDFLLGAIETARKEGGSELRIERLKAMVRTVEQMEANISAGVGGKGADKAVTTLKALLGMLSEGEHLLGTALKELPSSGSPSFAALASDPAVASRAAELYPGYYDQLWETRRPIFRGGEVKDDLKKAISQEAQARALAQAQRESARGAPFELAPGAPARAHVDPNVDFPFGFYDRAGFDQFSRRLNAAIQPREPGAQLVVEGSSVTGRRFQRLVKPNEPSGAPFGVGRLSDYDVAIISDALYKEAHDLRILPKQGSLEPADLARLRLTDLDTAARAAILDATGIAHPVHFVIRASSSAEVAVRLPLHVR